MDAIARPLARLLREEDGLSTLEFAAFLAACGTVGFGMLFAGANQLMLCYGQTMVGR